jgi:autotransporter-associated beta strand protein
MNPTLFRTFKLSLFSIAAAMLSTTILSTTSWAANVIKADNADNLNLGTSWVSGSPPTSLDIGVWDSTVTTPNTTVLGANTNWAGIRISNPGGPVTINAGNFLTNGASGIDMSTANNALTLNNGVVLGANQTWNVAGGQTLTTGGAVSGAQTLTKAGDGLLVLGVADTYSGGTIVNGGVLQLNNGTAGGTFGITNNDGTILRFGAAVNVGNVFTINGNVIVDCNNIAGNTALLGAWLGSGTVTISNIQNSGRTFTLGGSGSGGGSMANFSGTFSGGNSVGFLRFNDNANQNLGSTNAIFDLGTGSVIMLARNGGVTINLGALSGGPNTIMQGRASGSSGTLTYSIGAKGLSTTFQGVITNSTVSGNLTAIVKVGPGSLTLTGTNSYTSTTTINAGILQIGNGGTSGSLAAASAINNNATLIFNHSDDITVGNAISGSGNTVKVGANIAAFTGNVTSSGSLVISNGTAAIGAANTFTCPIFVGSGATFDVTANPGFILSSPLSGFGTVISNLAAGAGASIRPGGNGVPGTILFSNLIENDAVINSMDLSDDPTGLIKTNDLIFVNGDLTIAGTNSISISLLNASIPAGTFKVIQYTGVLTGDPTNAFVVSGVNGKPIHDALAKTISVLVSTNRTATNVTWTGNSIANDWDELNKTNWLNNGNLDFFVSADRVRFDATGAANPVVNLIGVLKPASLIVDAAANYSFTGAGSISGGTSVVKTNSGTLTITSTNDYSGPTVIGGGTLEVSYLNNGSLFSGIGSASSNPTNLVFFGTTMRYTGPSTSSDRGATFNGAGANLEVPSGTLTLNGLLAGAGALTKSGGGTLTIGNPNTYAGGTVISNGVLALGSNGANDSGLGPTNSPVTFYGGTLQLFGYNGSTSPNYATCFNPLIVPVGQSGTLRMFSRGPSNSGANSGLRSSLTGGGTLNLVVNYVRDSLDGDWSAFTGTINVTPKPSGGGDEFRINNSFGYSNAIIILNDGVLMDRATTGNSTTDIGELGGTAAATIGAGNGSAANPTWRVGWKNTTNTFAGVIANDGSSSIIKVGTGTWILTGQNTYSGSTTISNGVLALQLGSLDGSIDNSSNIFIATPGALDVTGRSDGTLNLGMVAPQTLHGNGVLRGSLLVGGSGTVAPGFSIGTLTVTNVATLGGNALMEVNRPNFSDKLIAPSIIFGGTLTVTNVGANLQVNDTFDLFDGGLSGSFAILALPNYYTWDTSNLGVDGTIKVTGVLPGPTISSVDSSQLAFGTLILNAINGAANGPFAVLTSTNAALPSSSWTVAATGNFDGAGNLTSFPVTVDPTTPQQFFLLKVW